MILITRVHSRYVERCRTPPPFFFPIMYHPRSIIARAVDMDTKMAKTSRWLAYVLRHGAAENGLRWRPGGWLMLSELETVGWSSEAELLALLQTDTVGRFQAFCSHGTFWLRATPGRGRGSPPEQTQHLLPPHHTNDDQTLSGGAHHAGTTPAVVAPSRASPVWTGEWVGPW